MAYTTFSQTKNDQLQEPMFFGQSVNVARFDQQKHEIFEKLIEKSAEKKRFNNFKTTCGKRSLNETSKIFRTVIYEFVHYTLI